MKINLKKYAAVRKILPKILGALLSLGALAALYFTLVLAQPQGGPAQSPEPQPVLSPSPSMAITSEGELRELAQTFPAPVMSFMSGSGMQFVSGTSVDAAVGRSKGRVLTLTWQTPEGEPLSLRSIYPAEALELMGKGDYHFSSVAGPSLFGLSSVRMENRETVRVHVQAAGRGLYVLTVPASLAGSLSDICRSVQLFAVE